MMRLIKRTFLLLLPLFFTLNVNAYEGTPEEQVDAFFEEFEQGKTTEAVDNLFAQTPMAVDNVQLHLDILKASIKEMNEEYGDFLRTENIHNEQLSPSINRIVQVAVFEKTPVIVEFYFYKPQDKWIFNRLMYSSNYSFIEKIK